MTSNHPTTDPATVAPAASMVEMAELASLRSWLVTQGVEPFTTAELLSAAGPYRRLGWRPNGSEGLRFLASAIDAALKEGE